MLQLFTGRKVISARRHDGRLSDTMPTAKRGQRGIRQHYTARCEFLMDSHEVPLAGAEQFQDLLPVRFGFLGTL